MAAVEAVEVVMEGVVEVGALDDCALIRIGV